MHKLLFRNKLTITIVIVCFALSCIGISWGRVEEWHPDQRAFYSLFHAHFPPLHPAWFLIPPFHTYFNYFLSVLPFSLLNEILALPMSTVFAYRLIWSRLLTIFLYIGSGLCVYLVVRKISGAATARITLALFLTSAGVVSNAHFLTADIPVMFWVTLAVYICFRAYSSKHMRGLLIAGFIVGIAAATKYNGVVGVFAVFVAYAGLCAYSFRKMVRNALWLVASILATIVGFIAGNPYAVIDYPFFIKDFLFLIYTDKLYFSPYPRNPMSGVYALTENIGWPALMIIIPGTLLVCYGLWKKKFNDEQKIAYLIALSIFVPNVFFLGGYTYVPMRYTIVMIPFLMILGSYVITRYKKNVLLQSALCLIIAYNVLCSVYVGLRFNSDPKTLAQQWVLQNVPKKSLIENYYYSPSWNLLPGADYTVTKSPHLSGRFRRFRENLNDDAIMVQRLREVDRENDEIKEWYSLSGLSKRSPDYITLDSLIYDRFINDEVTRQYYPEIFEYYNALLHERTAYKIIFDHTSLPPLPYGYPRSIDVVDNRFVILHNTNSTIQTPED